MRVRLIRHGLTALGETGKYQGSLDVGLSEKGRAQLCRASRTPGEVYVSPALRARETAAILFPEARQIVVPDLREMDFGVFEGRSWQEMEDDPAYRAWVEANCEGQCPGGEDRAGFAARIRAAMQAIFEREKDSAEAVIVAHGGTQMAALEHWGPEPGEYFRWQTACGCGWLLDRDGEALRIVKKIGFLA